MQQPDALGQVQHRRAGPRSGLATIVLAHRTSSQVPREIRGSCETMSTTSRSGRSDRTGRCPSTGRSQREADATPGGALDRLRTSTDQCVPARPWSAGGVLKPRRIRIQCDTPGTGLHNVHYGDSRREPTRPAGSCVCLSEPGQQDKQGWRSASMSSRATSRFHAAAARSGTDETRDVRSSAWRVGDRATRCAATPVAPDGRRAG